MKKTWYILATIAVATLVAYFALPIRFFVEPVFPLMENSTLEAYDDKYDGGKSEISFTLQDSSASFSCALGSAEEKGGWCGLLFDLRKKSGVEILNRDWNFVDSVIFDVESGGTSEVLVKIWTYDADVTDTTVARSYRLLMKELPLKGGRERLAVPLEQFYTPDFWYSDNGVDTSMAERHQDEVVRLEIAPGWNQPRQKRWSLTIHEISAKGLSNKTFGAVLFVMLILTIVAVGRKHSFEQEDKSGDLKKGK